MHVMERVKGGIYDLVKHHWSSVFSKINNRIAPSLIIGKVLSTSLPFQSWQLYQNNICKHCSLVVNVTFKKHLQKEKRKYSIKLLNKQSTI